MAKAKLNKNAQKWVKALRSGKYKQATGQLKRQDDGGSTTFCCLGVACELAVKAGAIKAYLGWNGALPGEVRQWLGLSSTEGRFEKKKLKGSFVIDLTDLNDNLKYSFKQIARFIESKPEGLFVD